MRGFVAGSRLRLRFGRLLAGAALRLGLGIFFRDGFRRCFGVCLRVARCCLVSFYSNLLGALSTTARTAALRLGLGIIISGIAASITS